MQGSATLFRRRLLTWYDRHRRELPWRNPKSATAEAAHVNPYHALVSEFMLQQTQVATVIPYFHSFIARFPTFADLAAAGEQDVLRLWQGLGYYSRARNLHRCAQRVMSDFGGDLPADVASLRTLPGVGRYTAGAISSIAFEQRAPILDGNVTRVLCRLDQIAADPREPRTQERLWLRAEQLLPRRRVGDFNSALMELGSLVCTPRSPQCLVCPVRVHCDALIAGVQETIPAPRKAKPSPLLTRWTFCIRHGDHWLLEQRPATGRWAGLWQFITLEPNGHPPAAPSPAAAKPTLRRLPAAVSTATSLGVVTHALTHRRYEFHVYACDAKGDELAGCAAQRRWVRLDELPHYPLPRPHLRIAEMLADRR